ncbi:MAG: ribonuclease HI family protein [Candidatus Dojkabacteria bacterium]|jgi:ribonuclease HI|nr:ribonuclease HI family protein [Candidatus Dojkabacteria bacterium]
MEKKIKVYTDGGARGNPGPAAGGIVIFDEDGKLLAIDAKYFGNTTNNQAEYQALELAIKLLIKRNITGRILCYLDSELAVKQLKGEYKVKNSGIARVKEKIDGLLKTFQSIEFIHVRREENKFADKLVNVILDAREKL